MLLRFAVANHLSMRASQELSLAASSLRDRNDGLIPCAAAQGGSVLPATVLYGANASGKSNVVNAIAAMRNMVLWSQIRGEPGGGIPPRRAFGLDSACSQDPSRFEIDFVIDGARYHYGFEATDDAFVAEWLYVFPQSHRRKMFERSGDKFNFGRWLKGQNNLIAGLTRPNSLFLSAAAQNGHKQLSAVYEYFRSIRFVHAISVSGPNASALLAEDEPDKRVIDFLKSINTGVIGYKKKEAEIPAKDRAMQREIISVVEKFMGSSATMTPDPDDKLVAIELAHRGWQGEPVYLDLDSESAGTRRLLLALDLVYQALDKGTLVCIDEVDASLHTLASEAILKLFCQPETNRNGAQLIATTHDTNLMQSSLLRRDQLWFTEKTPEGATELYPLTDIRTRKGDNIRSGYLQGRFGALPPVDDVTAPTRLQD